MKTPLVAIFASVLLLDISNSSRISYGHGTIVLVSIERGAIFMLTDTHQLMHDQFGDHDAENPNKVVICNKFFLCGVAGISPLTGPASTGKNIVWTYENFIQQLDLANSDVLDVKSYADKLGLEAVKGFNSAFSRSPDYWKNKDIATSGSLMSFTVAGYDGPDAEVCQVWILQDATNKNFPQPRRKCVPPIHTDPASFSTYCMNGMKNFFDESLNDIAPRSPHLSAFRKEGQVAAKEKLPQLPRNFQEDIALDATIIRLHGEAVPHKFGASVRIGVVEQGKAPSIETLLPPPRKLDPSQHKKYEDLTECDVQLIPWIHHR